MAALYPAPCQLPRFVDPRQADARGLVDVTPHMDPILLIAAYSQGLFPWSSRPVCWFSPDPRAIFLPEGAHVPRNVAKLRRRAGFVVSFDRAFEAVMRGCRDCHAAEGEWIDATFLAAYLQLHRWGFAHSVEVWQGDELAGGLYGVQLGGLFAGESMFYRRANASKVAFAALLPQLWRTGVTLFDAQVLNDNSARLGAIEVPRLEYLRRLAEAVPSQLPLRPSAWSDGPDCTTEAAAAGDGGSP